MSRAGTWRELIHSIVASRQKGIIADGDDPLEPRNDSLTDTIIQYLAAASHAPSGTDG